jgi:hypothetical protein
LLLVLGDLVRELAQRGTPIDTTINAVLRGYDDAAPEVYDDEPPEGRSQGASVRIVAAFHARGMHLPAPEVRAVPCTAEQIKRAIPERWVAARTIARTLGYRSEQRASVTYDTQLIDLQRSDLRWSMQLNDFVRALDFMATYDRQVQRQCVDHADQRGAVRYRRVP